MDGRDFSQTHVCNYLLSSLLGAGASGTVYRAIDVSMENSPAYAVKCVRKSTQPGRLSQQYAEIDNHDALALCPNVLRLCDSLEFDDFFCLVLPLCEKDMFRAIFKERKYWRNDALIRKAFIEVLDGVISCHGKGVFHRDLKPENIMCNAEGSKCKIGDFGLSTVRRKCKDGGCGTASYMSPECLNEKESRYDAGLADIWSLGVILFNMVTCHYPWDEARPTDKKYMAFQSKPSHFLHTYQVSESLSVLLCQIWNPTPAKRMSIQAIRQAILEIDTFYRPSHSSHAASQLSKVGVLVDSEQTCVAPAGDEKERGIRASVDVLEEMFCRLEVMIQGLTKE